MPKGSVVKGDVAKKSALFSNGPIRKPVLVKGRCYIIKPRWRLRLCRGNCSKRALFFYWFTFYFMLFILVFCIIFINHGENWRTMVRIDPLTFDQKINTYPTVLTLFPTPTTCKCIIIFMCHPPPCSTSTYMCIKIKLLLHTHLFRLLVIYFIGIQQRNLDVPQQKI